MVQTPGYYTYHESIAASGFVRATQTACADTAETTVVTGQPKIVTQVSSQTAAPGKTITDKVTISGLGVLQAPVKVVLWGPFETRGGDHAAPARRTGRARSRPPATARTTRDRSR